MNRLEKLTARTSHAPSASPARYYLLALDHTEWLGRGRHADRIGDDPLAAMTKASAKTAAKANLLHIALPPREYLGQS
jgi:hypothetical protein